MTPWNPRATTDRNVTFLVADLQIGLRFARAAIRTTDPWTVAVNRRNAERVHDAVRRLIDRLSIGPPGRAFLQPRLEQLRLAIQVAYAQRPGDLWSLTPPQ